MSSRRLKHFCELCRKQCKDENGFKCHLNSQSHQMRVREFASNPAEHIEKASRQFQGRFIQMLKSKYPGEPRFLQELYNQLLEEKKFLKFNHTMWKNLSQFGTHLSTVKNLQVVGTPPNCKVVYVVNKTKDFIEAAKKQKLIADREREKEQFEKSIASRIEKEKEYAVQQQVLLNAKLAQLQKESLKMEIPDKLELNIEGFNSEVKRSAFYTTEELEKEVANQKIYEKKVDDIERLYKKLKQENDHSEDQQEIEWIKAGITIKIKPHEDIETVFHNKKCKITKIVEPFVAEVHLGTASIEIDQTNLETVIPKLGHSVMILYGKYSGEVGILKQANLQEGFGVIEVKQELTKIPFNLFSRYDRQ